MTQVYLQKYGIWSDVLDECDAFVVAKDADGVNVYVVKDALILVRNKE